MINLQEQDCFNSQFVPQFNQTALNSKKYTNASKAAFSSTGKPRLTNVSKIRKFDWNLQIYFISCEMDNYEFIAILQKH